MWLESDRFRQGTNFASSNTFFAPNKIALDVALPAAFRSVLVDYGAIGPPVIAPVVGVPGSAGPPATGQLLAGVGTKNAPSGTYYPLYLGDRVGLIRAILDVLTVAGVIPELEVRLL